VMKEQVSSFLRMHLLHWIEVHSWLVMLDVGLKMVALLEAVYVSSVRDDDNICY
jgi:hypothetical protein